ncbi:MAG: rhodanese-like domain-containing protein [Candidatus Latescibacterota bacterium]|nr:rhodanese-like domain-containing protein [Candidatus Latescibacterota bacterium]
MSGHESQRYLLFDVRRREELERSHLEGALHVDPDEMAQQFMAVHRERLSGRHLGFYCSVGYRSARLLESVRSESETKAPASVTNLRGGLFR